jgi:hypothetical protein
MTNCGQSLFDKFLQIQEDFFMAAKGFQSNYNKKVGTISGFIPFERLL